MKIFTFLIVSLFISIDIFSQSLFEKENVTVELFRQFDGKVIKLKNVKLITKTINFSQNSNIDSIISSMGIFPDVECYNLIYQLNPKLKSLNVINLTTLIFPTIKTANNKELKKYLDDRYLALLTTNAALKKSIIQLISKIINNGNQPHTAVKLPPSQDTSKIFSILSFLDSSSLSISNIIKNKSKILTRATLTPLKDELSLLYSIKLKQSLTQGEIITIYYLNESMHIRNSIWMQTRSMDDVFPEQYPFGDVLIKVKDSLGKMVMGLRVYYVPTALINDSKKYKQFPELTSPSKDRLPVANYFMWASNPGTYLPITDKLLVNLNETDNGQPVNYDLKLIK